MSLFTINEKKKIGENCLCVKKKKTFNNIPENIGNICWKCLKDCEFF